MRNLILIIIITGLLYTCNGQKKVEFESYEPNYTVDELISSLDSVYLRLDTLGLIEFLKGWNQDIKPNEIKYINQNKCIESVYDIYGTFYIPRTPYNLGDWEAFHIPENSLEYFIIQNKIFYTVLPANEFEKFNWKTHKVDSIYNFKPRLENIEQERILYLTSEYSIAINRFFGSNYYELGTGNLMNPSLPEGESKKRYEF